MHVLDVPGSVAGINDKGQLVGNYLRGNNLRGYITGPGGIGYRDIGTLGGRSTQVSNLNASGQAIGMSASAEDGNGTETHAFITGPNGVGMTDLKLPGAWTSEPTGINDRGEVSGTQWFGNNGDRQQFVTGPDGVGIKLLGTLGNLPGGRSEGGGINNQGTVVGASSRGTKYRHIQLTVTPRGGRMQGLDKHIVNLPEGVYLTDNAVINNANQIAALGNNGLCYIVCPNQDCKR